MLAQCSEREGRLRKCVLLKEGGLAGPFCDSHIGELGRA